MRLYFVSFLATLFLLHQPALAQPRRDTTITIKTAEGLQFSEKRLVLRPRTRLTLIVQNEDDMAHNLVVVKPNTRARVVEFALAMGQDGPAKNYVPNLPDVVAHTRLMDPGTRDTLRLTLPDEGDFSYVCTYPGHGSIMYGMLYVTTRPNSLPPISNDPNLPKNPADGASVHMHEAPSGHPYVLKLPAVYRTFMPDASPAAIAVGLPGIQGGPQQAYCWDATTCQLRYAWSGGFVDNSEQWDGKGQRFTKIVGDYFFRDSTFITPWYVGDQPASMQFKGYQLLDRYPEFSYLVNGVQVRELTKPQLGKRGLLRRFTIAPTAKSLRFRLGDQANQYKTSAGRIANGWLNVPANTRTFTLTVN